jgi:hypothetical protein
MRVVAIARSNLNRFMVAAFLVVALLVVVQNRVWGATACPSSSPGTQCPKAVKTTAKAPAVAAVTVVAAEASPIATSWKSTLDPLSAGGWALITDGPVDNPSVVYASTHNVLHNGNVVTAWIRWEYSRIQAEIYPLHYQSAVTREELDCDARTYRRAAVFYYRRNNLQDKALQFTALNDDTNWKLAIPGTEGDAMLTWACAPPPAAHHDLAEARVLARKITDKAGDKPDASTAAGKSGAATPAAPGGIDLHTAR